MLHITSALKGCRLELTDGSLGKVDDFLFDDRTWKIRWLVVDTGSWLSGHKVLLHPSAIKEADPDERIVRLGHKGPSGSEPQYTQRSASVAAV